MDGWSASAVLAHLAFWDRFTLGRWRTYLAGREAGIAPLTDVLNAASPPDVGPRCRPRSRHVRRSRPPMRSTPSSRPSRRTRSHGCSPSAGRAGSIRSEHRGEHLDNIERALAG